MYSFIYIITFIQSYLKVTKIFAEYCIKENTDIWKMTRSITATKFTFY